MPWVSDRNVALFTDLYELTMAASYFRQGMTGPATFDLFVRALPENRNFLICCGVDDALDYLEALSFDAEAISYLRTLAIFEEPFLDYLAAFRFTGDVHAIPEGEPVFANEPILRVTAPLIEAQIVETFLLNCINFQTLIASKAARIAIACAGRQFVDFSARRDHGVDAALKAARAAYIGGAVATSNVVAGQTYGIPLSGTMAHAYVMSFADEADAFRAFARDFPDRAILLIDTYDTLDAARKVVQVAADLAAEGIRIQGVRLDSGDIADLARGVRAILDEARLGDAQIFASGDLDEYRIAALIGAGAPIDAFGVGTQLGTSADAPALSGVYKLVENERGGAMKLSPGKATLPGRKQVFRFSEAGRYEGDVIALDGEAVPGGTALLREVMKGGRRLEERAALALIRERCAGSVARLPDRLKDLAAAREPYRVSYSAALEGLRGRLQLPRS